MHMFMNLYSGFEEGDPKLAPFPSRWFDLSIVRQVDSFVSNPHSHRHAYAGLGWVEQASTAS